MARKKLKISPLKRFSRSLIGTGYLLSVKPIPYEKIARKLGKQNDLGPSPDGKTQHEWHVRVGNTVFSVYDYEGERWFIGGPAGKIDLALKLKEYLEG